MDQLTLDDFIDGNKELICCQLSEGYHWLRITSGHSPIAVVDRKHFILDGYDHFYEGTQGKDEIIGLFDGPIKIVEWEEA